jgi:sec-independent protein translocase protein TatC
MTETPGINPSRILSFTDHLQELRIRIIICIVFFVAMFIVGFTQAPKIVGFLVVPLASLTKNPDKPVLTLLLQNDGGVRWSVESATGRPVASDGSSTTTITTGTAQFPALLNNASLTDGEIRIKTEASSASMYVGRKGHNSLFYLSPLEPFFLWLQAALLVSAVFAIPMIVYQGYLFVSPGLLRHERHVIAPILGVSLILFPAGAGFAYLIISITLKALMAFGDAIPGLEPNLVASRYLSLVITMMLVFGALFEFPLILVLLARLGIIDSQFLVKRRKFSIVVITAIAAVATPSTDPFTMLLLMFPLLGLYEGAIWSIKLLERTSPLGSPSLARD